MALLPVFNMQRAWNLIILGAPGGGKGTISKKILNKFAYNHVSTGDLLRSHIQKGTDLGEKAKAFMNQGKLVPDDLVVDMLKKTVKNDSPGVSGRLLLDGFPRNIEQAKSLESVVHIHQVIHLDIPHAEILRRLSQRWVHAPSGRVYNLEYNPPISEGLDDVTKEPLTQRDDDKPEFIQKRLDDYEAMTSPLVSHYKNSKGTIVTSFAGTESDVIFVDVEKSLSMIQ